MTIGKTRSLQHAIGTRRGHRTRFHSAHVSFRMKFIVQGILFKEEVKFCLNILEISLIIATHCKSILEPPENTDLKYVPSSVTSHLILQSGMTICQP